MTLGRYIVAGHQDAGQCWCGYFNHMEAEQPEEETR
jgi:hypothetical protein